MDVNKVIALKVKDARNKKKMSAESVANILNLSKGAYSNIENAKVDFTFKRLEEISKALDIDITEISPYSNSNTQISHGSGNNINGCDTVNIQTDPVLIDSIQACIKSLEFTLSLMTNKK
jgi:transcriptional regulator with XRE-family HTH domain